MIYLLNFILLSAFSLFIVFFSPDLIINRVIFFVLIALIFFVISRFIFQKLKINLILSGYFITLLILQMFGLLNLLNLVLAATLFFLIYIAS